MRHVIRSFWSGLAVAGVLTIGSAFAQEPAAPAAQPKDRDSAPQAQSPKDVDPAPQAQSPKDSDAASQAQSRQVAMPTCLAKLTLTPEQQTQIQKVVREYDTDVAAVWKQFGDRYLETVRTEATLLSAIEDNLTETQRQQVRGQRCRVAQHEKKLAETNAEGKEATAKPASAVQEEIAIVGVPLTSDQEAAADAVQEKYLSRLRSLNRSVEGLHNRLVSLEADKLVEIEKFLTKDQLKQLCDIRQSAPPSEPEEVSSRTDTAPTR